jgi:hypothetical protein
LASRGHGRGSACSFPYAFSMEPMVEISTCRCTRVHVRCASWLALAGGGSGCAGWQQGARSDIRPAGRPAPQRQEGAAASHGRSQLPPDRAQCRPDQEHRHEHRKGRVGRSSFGLSDYVVQRTQQRGLSAICRDHPCEDQAKCNDHRPYQAVENATNVARFAAAHFAPLGKRAPWDILGERPQGAQGDGGSGEGT